MNGQLKVSGSKFIGSQATSHYGGNPPLGPGGGHWAASTKSTIFGTSIQQEASMDPDVTNGTRKYLTTLDAMALKDIGWSILQPVPPPFPTPNYNPADFNEDTFVNAADLTQWKSAFGLNANGDANGDNRTDGADFLLWQRNFGRDICDGRIIRGPRTRNRLPRRPGRLRLSTSFPSALIAQAVSRPLQRPHLAPHSAPTRRSARSKAPARSAECSCPFAARQVSRTRRTRSSAFAPATCSASWNPLATNNWAPTPRSSGIRHTGWSRIVRMRLRVTTVAVTRASPSSSAVDSGLALANQRPSECRRQPAVQRQSAHRRVDHWTAAVQMELQRPPSPQRGLAAGFVAGTGGRPATGSRTAFMRRPPGARPLASPRAV